MALFADPYYGVSFYESYPGLDPFVVVISGSGAVEYEGVTRSAGCTSAVTDGSSVYLAVPQAREVQVLNVSSHAVATYPIGIAASNLLWEDGALFAISNDAVKVYDRSMDLEKTIDFGPLTFSSDSNSLPFETALHTPSFLILNGTTYAALLENATGYSRLVVGKYA